jgi:hypothetical protein
MALDSAAGAVLCSDHLRRLLTVASVRPAVHGRSSWWRVGPVAKFLFVAFVPTVVILGAAEGIARYLARSEPAPDGGLYVERAGISRPDPDVFWSIQPNLRGYLEDKWLTTNSLGLRGAEIGPKQPDEYRILSLGESTAFGFGVDDGDTYAERLEHALRARQPGRAVRVINAGVPAYSSFQSLVYLKTRGLDLEPDAVLIYHWANDFLPASYRDSRNHEIGAGRSDKELYELHKTLYIDTLIRHSALFRAGVNFLARRSVERFRAHRPRDDDRAPAQLAWSPVFFPHQSPVRVRPSERQEVLREFLELSEVHGFELVVIHPTYRDVEEYDPLLVRFCGDHDVPMIDAPAIFAAAPVPRSELFLDSMHPTAPGHALIVGALLRYFARAVARESRQSPPQGTRARAGQ